MKYNYLTNKMINTTQQPVKIVLAFIAVLLISSNINLWADKDATINTTDVISSENKVRTWNLVPSPALASDYKIPLAGETHNDIVYIPGAKDKQKVAKSSGISSQAQSNIYIPVPSGSAGSISISVYSNSDSRYLQLYISGSAGTESQRLYSKLNAGGITADGKKGPQTFNFTSSDITTYDSKTYLHFKDNNTEMKISGFVVTLTTGTYPSAATYTVTYDANGGTGSMTDSDSPYSGSSSVTVLTNGFTAPSSKVFSNWNTAADGSGTSYDPDDTFTITENTTLYAQWVSICAPTIAASCLATDWAPGIDYLKNAPETISWTAIATASSGDPSKLRYKWYRYPVGHPEDVEEAEGTNDQATFTPSSTDLHDWMEYYCRVTEVGCSGYADTHVTGAVRIVTTVSGWVVFEGELFDNLVSSPVPYYPASGIPTHPGTIAYTISSSSVVDVSAKTNNYDVTKNFAKGIQISKSTSGYFGFTIPDGYTATFTYAFSGTGNRTIMLASEKINSTSASGYIATLTSAVKSGTIEGGSYTTPLSAGTYYICEGGSGNWQIVELIFTLTATGAACSPTITTGKAVGWAGGAVYAKNDPTTLTYTVVASASNGGTLTYKWKSFPAVGGSKLTAVDAAGTNDQASYTPPTDIVHADYIYFCVVGETGCSGTDETELTGAVRVNEKGWIIFDGATDDAARTSPIKYFNGTAFDDIKVTMTYSTKGTWSKYDISDRTNNSGDGKTYPNAWKAGGTASSDNNYLTFTIPDGYTATFDYVFATGSNNAVYKLGTTPNGDELGTLTTFPSSGATKVLQGGTYSTPLSAGTYYLGNSNTIHIAKLIFNLTEEACTAPVNTSPTFGGKDNYKLGDTPVLSFTASATPQNGGTISYKWYQNTTGTKVGAVEADLDATGYNDRATYTPRTDIEGTHYYYCVMKETGCTKTAETNLSGIVTVIDPCNSWGYGTSHTELITSGDIVVGDLTIKGIGGVSKKTASAFDGSGDLDYIINPNSKDKYITGSLGGKKIEKVIISASTTAALDAGWNKEAMSIAFSSKSTFDPNYLLDYSEGVQVHIFKVAPNTASKTNYVITAPAKAKSFALGRNFDIGAGKTFDCTADQIVSDWSNDRYLYFVSVCPSDDCTPEFDAQPESQTVDEGETVTLSVTSEDATNYQWFINTANNNTTGSTISGAISSSYTFTASTKGTYYYYCNIMKGTCPSNSSDVAIVEVLKGCDDEIIASALSGGNKVVTSASGCTADIYLESTGKIGGSRYCTITLSDGYFQDDDEVSVNISSVGDIGGGILAIVYGTKDSYSGGMAMPAVVGENKFVLSGVPANVQSITIPRTYNISGEDATQNHTLSKSDYTIKVQRLVCHACTPPTITAQPSGTASVIFPDEPHTLSVTATGAATYQWYKDNVAQAGKTSASFSTNEAGVWYCHVLSADGCFARTKKVNVDVKPYYVFKKTTDNNWGTVGNWFEAWTDPYTAGDPAGALPTIDNRVVLLDSCYVNINNAQAQQVRIATGTAGAVTGKGKLVIGHTGALTIASTLLKYEGNGTTFGSGSQTTPTDLIIESSNTGQGALAFWQNTNIPKATVIQYVKAYYNKANNDAKWQYIGIPFADEYAINLYYFYAAWMNEWYEDENIWDPVDENAHANPFQGYALTQKDNASGEYYVNEGVLCTPETKLIPLDYSGTSNGRNLLANSWTSPIYASEMQDADFTNANKVFYVFNTGSYNQWASAYQENTINTGALATEPAEGQYITIPIHAASYLGQQTIAPMQGFFIYADDDNAQLKLDYERVVLNKSTLTKDTRPRRSPAKARQEDNISLTSIIVASETGADKAYILTGKDEFHNTYDDGWDGRKLTGNDNLPYIAIETSSGRMAVSAQPQLLGTTINFRAGSDQFYDLIVCTQESDLQLKDMEMNITIPLRDTTIYSFYTTNKNYSSRFHIVKESKVITDLENQSDNLINTMVIDGNIVVNNFTGESVDIRVYDMTGKLLLTRPTDSELTTIPIQSGTYMIRIKDQTFKIVK